MKTRAVSFESEHFTMFVGKGSYTLRLQDDDMGAGLLLISTSSRREFSGILDEMQDELRAFAWEIDRGYGVIKDIDPESFKPEPEPTSSEEESING